MLIYRKIRLNISNKKKYQVKKKETICNLTGRTDFYLI